MVIAKLGAKSPGDDESPSSKELTLDEPLSALLLQAIKAAINTNANGIRNRSLLGWPTAIFPLGWLSSESALNISSALTPRLNATPLQFVCLDAAALKRFQDWPIPLGQPPKEGMNQCHLGSLLIRRAARDGLLWGRQIKRPTRYLVGGRRRAGQSFEVFLKYEEPLQHSG